jgi:hypothetical protein
MDPQPIRKYLQLAKTFPQHFCLHLETDHSVLFFGLEVVLLCGAFTLYVMMSCVADNVSGICACKRREERTKEVC